MSSTDRIEKSVFLRASRARVWEALSDAEKFGEWFGVKLNGAFSPGARLQGKVMIPGYEDCKFEITIERVEPQRLFSWRWHPHAVDPNLDYSAEPTTLVVFELEEVPGGTQLTVVESGFDGIPLARRLEAYRGNTQGWTSQLEAIERYVAKTI